MTHAKDSPAHGEMVTLEPGIRRIVAPNPSPMTYWGTNSFVLGEGAVTLVDPGPALSEHLDAILAGLAPGETVERILVTHAHVDHSPLARPLSEATGAPVIAFGDARAGRSEVMRSLVARGMPSGGEGVDATFVPDECLADGETLDIGGAVVTALWTPGHFANHLSFALGDAVLVGDHVMAWSSSLVSPPDGDLTAFMASSHKLRARGDRVHYPAHGPSIEAPSERLTWLIEHRQSREAAIRRALAEAGPQTAASLTARIYTDTPPALMPAAERNVFAHLIDLAARGLVSADPTIAPDALFAPS